MKTNEVLFYPLRTYRDWQINRWADKILGMHWYLPIQQVKPQESSALSSRAIASPIDLKTIGRKEIEKFFLGPSDFKTKEEAMFRLVPLYNQTGHKEIGEIIRDLIDETNGGLKFNSLIEEIASVVALASRLSPRKVDPDQFRDDSLFDFLWLKKFGIFGPTGNICISDEDREIIMKTLTLVPQTHLLGVRVIGVHDIWHLIQFERELGREIDRDTILAIENEGENSETARRWLMERESSYQYETRAIRLHSTHIEEPPVLVHEIGHAVWHYNLSEDQRNAFERAGQWIGTGKAGALSDPNNFAETYGMKNVKEDWATLYSAWVTDSKNLKEKGKASPILRVKIASLVLGAFTIVTANGEKMVISYTKGIPEAMVLPKV